MEKVMARARESESTETGRESQQDLSVAREATAWAYRASRVRANWSVAKLHSEGARDYQDNACQALITPDYVPSIPLITERKRFIIVVGLLARQPYLLQFPMQKIADHLSTSNAHCIVQCTNVQRRRSYVCESEEHHRRDQA